MSLILEDEKPAPKEPLSALTRLPGERRLDLGLALAGAVLALLILLGLGGPVLAPVTLLGCLVLPGWVLVRRLPGADPLARAVWTIVMSAAAFTVLSLAMVWTGLWQPRPVAAAVLLAASAVIMAVPAPAAAAGRRPLDWRGVWRLDGLRHRNLSSYVPWAILALAMVLWGVALALTGEELVGDRGLLTTFPLLWYVAAAAVAALCIWGVVARRMASTAFLGASFAGLVAVLYASAAMVVSVPRLPWSYKHIAVTNYIGATGQVDPSIDIYNRWPGFFSFSAFLGEVVGYRDAVDYASLAEFTFALLDVAIVLAIVRSLSSNPRIYWTATLVFTLTNWVNQNYYSPQAFSYTLYLTMCLIALTFLRSAPSRAAGFIEGRLGALQGRSKRHRAAVTETEPPAPARAMMVPAAVALLLLQAVAVASHQLTPYLAVLALAPLCVFGYFRPKWLAPAMVLIAVVYLLPNLDFVANKYGLFSGFDVVKNAGYDVPQDLPLGDLSAWLARSPDVLSLLVGALGVAGFVRNLLRGNIRQTVLVGWLAVAPVFWLLVQSYGGEAKFRVYLFALPFLAVGAAWLFWSGPLRARKAALGATAALTAMAVLFTVAYFQSEAKFRVEKSDVAAAKWLDGKVQSKDAIFQTSAFFPLLIGPNYPSYLEWGRLTSLTKLIQSSERQLTAADVERYADKNWNPERVYVVFSDSQLAQVVRDNMFDAGKLPALEQQMTSANNVDTVFNNGAVRIYQIRKTG